MSKVNEINAPEAAAGAVQAQDNPYLVIFSKPYLFEGKEYRQLDLKGLENMTSEQFFEASRAFSTTDYITPRPEADAKFCCLLAAEACDLPKEFFNGLPIKYSRKVRNIVQDFFQEED